jgi:hypothetical protein
MSVLYDYVIFKVKETQSKKHIRVVDRVSYGEKITVFGTGNRRVLYLGEHEREEFGYSPLKTRTVLSVRDFINTRKIKVYANGKKRFTFNRSTREGEFIAKNYIALDVNDVIVKNMTGALFELDRNYYPIEK